MTSRGRRFRSYNLLVDKEDVLICGGSVTAAEERARRGLDSAELSRAGRVGALGDERMQVGDMNGLLSLMLDGLVSSGDESNKEREHHVNEQRDERVKVHLTEDPDQHAALLHATERHKHVISIDQREKTLGHRRQRAELNMVWSQHNPATEAITEVDHRHTATEPDHVRESSL